MYEQEDADDFYLAGRKLAAHIAYFKEKDISVATLQALMGTSKKEIFPSLNCS